MERSKKPSEEQKEILLDFMEMNLDFACDRFESSDGAFLRHEKWNELAEKLNSVGGAVKEAKKWRKYWTDQKLHVKERRALLDASINKSGVNGTRMLKPLTALERRIGSLLNPSSVSGSGEVSELFGSTSQQNEEPDYIETEYLEEELESSTIATINQVQQDTPQRLTTSTSTRKRKRAPSGQTRDKEFDVQLLELEKQKFEFEKAQREREHALRKKEFELKEFVEKKKLDLEEQKLVLMERELVLKENAARNHF